MGWFLYVLGIAVMWFSLTKNEGFQDQNAYARLNRDYATMFTKANEAIMNPTIGYQRVFVKAKAPPH